MASGPMTGMNISDVQSLATAMDNAANEIETAMQKVTSKLRGTTWVGPDRDRFESSWNSQCTAQLRSVNQLLQDAATQARRNADEQQQASS